MVSWFFFANFDLGEGVPLKDPILMYFLEQNLSII